MASGTLGRNETTRSPRTTPRARRCVATARTWWVNCSQGSSRSPCVSSANRSAGSPGRSWSRMRSARFSRAPGNQRAPGMARLSRTAGVRRGGVDAEEVPDRLPELLELGGRPRPQLRVVGELPTGPLGGEAGELGERRALAHGPPGASRAGHPPAPGRRRRSCWATSVGGWGDRHGQTVVQSTRDGQHSSGRFSLCEKRQAGE